MSDVLTTRFARSAEVPEVAALAAHSFPGGGRTLEWWQEQLRTPGYGGTPEDTLYLGELGGKLVAALQLHPLRQWIGGEALPVAGVGSVAISPTQRQRRLGAALVTQALHEARARGDVASALYPFRVSFYQKLGYGNAGEVQQYQVPVIALRGSEERRWVELLDTAAAREEALRLYSEWARTQTGQLVRTDALWDRLVRAEEHALFGYRAADGTLEGYALVRYRPELKRRERYLEVEELVHVTGAARRGLHGWIASLGDQWEQVLLRAPASARLGDWLKEPRLPADAAPSWRLWSPAATLLGGLMFRLLDVPAAFARRAVAADATLAVTLDLTDDVLPVNTGRWRLLLEGGRATMEPATRASDSLTLDISTLSRIYIGALTPSQAHGAELLACDRPAMLPALDRALALPEPWTFDRF